ncbi:MAG: ParA family protein [Thiomonas sp.]|uniref:Putative ATPase involved in chromosome partitioning n=1 Tax=mine drainage metagenome TaxID=410659 RepID=E6PVW3_9ZZZZ
MPVVVIANPKGGVGKSTLSTQLAGYWATQGHKTMLGDADRQQSSRLWLSLRPQQAAPIGTWKLGPDYIARPPEGTSHVVIDTPAGLHGWRSNDVLRMANKLIVPVQASIFDIYAAQDFLAKLREDRKLKDLDVGLVGVRVDERTRAAEQLREFFSRLPYPLLGMLRPTTTYAHMAAHGLTLWDVNPHQVEKDLNQWAGIVRWADAR